MFEGIDFVKIKKTLNVWCMVSMIYIKKSSGFLVKQHAVYIKFLRHRGCSMSVVSAIKAEPCDMHSQAEPGNGKKRPKHPVYWL